MAYKLDLTSHEIGLLRLLMSDRIDHSRNEGISDEHASSVFRYSLWQKLFYAEAEAIRYEAVAHDGDRSTCTHCGVSIVYREEGGGWWFHEAGGMRARHPCASGSNVTVATPLPSDSSPVFN